MDRTRRHITAVRALTAAIATVYLWLGLSLTAGAQTLLHAAGEAHMGGGHADARPLPRVEAPTRLRLVRMENVGSQGAGGFMVAQPLTDREQLVLSDATHSLLERLSRLAGRSSALVRTAHFAARLYDMPNRALCRLTGADRARLDLRHKRVSFTWLVSW
jgi:hypothetical protein